MRSYPPLAVVAAQVLLGRGLQLQEVLLHRGPDGALDYPEKTHTPDRDRINFSAAVFLFFFVLTSARQLAGHHVLFFFFHLTPCSERFNVSSVAGRSVHVAALNSDKLEL